MTTRLASITLAAIVLVSLPALADDVLSADALRVAAARGRLEASKGADGTWRSSRVWVDAYKASRRRRG